MELTDPAKLALAGGVTLVTGFGVLGNALRGIRRERPAHPRAAVHPTTMSSEPAEVVPVRGAPGLSKPRILTGEPAPAERRRPALLRALKLVGGITVLAAGGAIGLLALVRALVAMFQRLG